MTALFWIVFLVASLVVLRTWLDRRISPPRQLDPFDGVVYPVGLAWVAERRAEQPRATVLCMHGFLENLHYFTEFYADPEIQLILVNSADYHLPISDPHIVSADWAHPPTAEPGTIAYDAEVLLQALEHLPASDTVRLHGHSRGGAVILEAAARRPELFRGVEVVLEAPVLPGANSRLPLSAPLLWLLPLVTPIWRRFPITALHRKLYGPLDNARKRRLIEGYPSNPRRPRTMRTNLLDLQHWMRSRGPELYQHLEQGTVVIATGDHVLDVDSMAASATQAADRLTVTEVPECSHFVTPDQPERIPPLPGAPPPRPDNQNTEEQT